MQAVQSCWAAVTLLFLSALLNTSFASDADETSCASDYGTLEQSLLSSRRNRYNLFKTFFPARDPHPVFVTVNYTFSKNSSSAAVLRWFWSEAEFYLIQPLEVFQFTSLFFANRPKRQGELVLELDESCQNTSGELLELLTARLKLYAETPTVSTDAIPARLTTAYVGVAAKEADLIAGRYQSTFVELWLHLVLVMFPVSTALLLYMCDPIRSLLGDKTWQKLEDESSHPNIAALLQISVIIVVYVFALDWFGCAYTVNSRLIDYDRQYIFYASVVTILVVDTFAFVLVIVVLVMLLVRNTREVVEHVFWKRVRPGNYESTYKIILVVLLAMVLCLSSHLVFIVVAFASDPIHAGSVWIGYLLSFFFFFFMLRRFYSVIDRRLRKHAAKISNSKSKDDKSGESDWRKPYFRVELNTKAILLGLISIVPALVLYESVMILLYTSLPISKTWNDAPSTLYNIFQGTGILIVILLTYNILLNPTPFSLVKTVDKIGHEIKIADSLPNWNKFSNEEKIANVVTALYSKGSVPLLREAGSKKKLRLHSEEKADQVLLMEEEVDSKNCDSDDNNAFATTSV